MKNRINIIDEIRGLCIILVVIYHTFYSMTMVFGMAEYFDIFRIMMFWQPVLPSMFIILSGISFHLSRSNIKRGVILLLISASITVILLIFMPSQTIWFGILHFLAVMNIVFGALKKYIDKIPFVIGLITFVLLFILTYNIQRGYIGIDGLLSVKLPEILYSTDFTAPLGVYSPSFRSADYCPIIPWTFMFFIGTLLGRYVNKLPEVLKKPHIKPLAFIGRHTLVIYLIHQPVIVGILYLISGKI